MTTIRFGSTLILAALAGCASTQNDVASTPKQTATTQTKTTPGGAPEMQLPPGWTAEDMQAMTAAMTPGAPQAQLAKGAGHWTGTQTMWMAPDAPPATSPVTATLTWMMDRYMKTEVSGNSEMGPFTGLGFTGFDNVSKKYVATWMDNYSTGIMTGEGTLSADGKTLTLIYHYNCPIAKKPQPMREVQHHNSDNSWSMDMYGNEPHTGKEYKMVHLDMTRSSP